jgi:hypothetical protein
MAITDRRNVTVSSVDPPIAGDPNPGLAWKAPVRAATTGSNIVLSGLQTIDGVVLAAADRVLVKDQTDATTNGLYNASTGSWTRTIDAASNDKFTQGLQVLVTSGAVNQNLIFELTSANPVTLGTSALTFLSANVPAIRRVNTTAPLAGGGSLAGDLTLSLTINASLQVTAQALAVAPLSAVPHQWISSINAAGVPQLTQPNVSDLAGLPVAVGQGGTGAATLTAHAVLLGEGTATFGFATIGTAGRMLIDQGSGADPSFNAMSGDGTITSAGALTVTKTSGTAFGTGATAAIATQAQAETGTSNAVLSTPLAVAQAIVALGQNFKNVVGRNGGLEVWQRLTNGATTIAVAASTTAYTVDGWYLATGANEASTITQVAGLTNNSRFGARVQRNSGQTGTGAIYFAIPLDTDELLKMAGQKVVVSFTASTGANWSPTSGTLVCNLYTGNTNAPAKRGGSAYASGDTNPINFSNNIAAGSAAARFVSALSSAVPSNITQAELQFTWTPTGTAGANDWFSIDDVQLEVVLDGAAPITPLFERSDYVWDLMRCQRFLPVFNNSSAATNALPMGQVFSTTRAQVTMTFPVQTRAPITGMTISAAADFGLNQANATLTACSSINFASGTLYSAFIVPILSSAVLVAGNASMLEFTASGVGQMIFTGAEI